MFHKSELDRYGHRFPHDRHGHVPVHSDHWRDMYFEHAEMDPHQEGISAEEQARRVEYLNSEWWPKILQQVSDERQRLVNEHGESFTDHWSKIVGQAPDVRHGFGVG